MGLFGRKKTKKPAKGQQSQSEKPELSEAKEQAKEQANNATDTAGKTAPNELEREASEDIDPYGENDIDPYFAEPENKDDEKKATVTDLPSGDPNLATNEITRDLVKKFISDIWNRGELDLIPEVCSPKIRFNGPDGMDKIGHDGFARMVATIHAALSDYHCEIHSMVVENNKAFCRLRFSGKHVGKLLGYAPSGEIVSWMGAAEYTCSNGLILKVWELGDMKTLEDQLKVS